jgi:hypothetical protein
MPAWSITYRDGNVDKVIAAYVSGQDDLPGWVILKDSDHKIVKMVLQEAVQSIERLVQA